MQSGRLRLRSASLASGPLSAIEGSLSAIEGSLSAIEGSLSAIEGSLTCHEEREISLKSASYRTALSLFTLLMVEDILLASSFMTR